MNDDTPTAVEPKVEPQRMSWRGPAREARSIPVPSKPTAVEVNGQKLKASDWSYKAGILSVVVTY